MRVEAAPGPVPVLVLVKRDSPSSPSNCSMASTALSCVLWWRWFGILVMFHGMDLHSGIRTGSQAAARTAGGHRAQDTASRATLSPGGSMSEGGWGYLR